jgi:hypothetical protein
MGFFLELYQTLLGFVMYRLYTLQGLKYPPNLENGRLDDLLDHLEIPQNPETTQTVSGKKPLFSFFQEQQKKTEQRIDTLNTDKLIAQEKALASTPTVTPTASSDVTMDDDEFEKEVKKIELNSNNQLFKGLKVFLSREVYSRFLSDSPPIRPLPSSWSF